MLCTIRETYSPASFAINPNDEKPCSLSTDTECALQKYQKTQNFTHSF